MDFKRRNGAEAAKWIVPFPEAAPGMKFLVREATSRETDRINDDHKFFPGVRGGTSMSKLSAVSADIVDLTVEGWEGVEEDGVALECSRKNKIAILLMDGDDLPKPLREKDEEGFTRNLYRVLISRIKAEREVAEKN